VIAEGDGLGAELQRHGAQEKEKGKRKRKKSKEYKTKVIA